MAGQTDKRVRRGLLRRLYDTCMAWLATPYGVPVLFFVALLESSVFPIPPDVFLIALAISSPHRSFYYAAICTAGSICGGILGYGLGFWFMESVGNFVMEVYHLGEKYDAVAALYTKYDALAIGAAGFTPLPYKLFTITAGAFHINFITFVLVSLCARGARFFLVSALIWKFGAPVRGFIERYFNILSLLFFVLLLLGFFLISFLMK